MSGTPQVRNLKFLPQTCIILTLSINIYCQTNKRKSVLRKPGHTLLVPYRIL